MDRIPFPRPDEPVLEARRERAGAGAFAVVDLPRAGTLLAQGAGRLIRSANDRGVVAVLDSRLGHGPLPGRPAGPGAADEADPATATRWWRSCRRSTPRPDRPPVAGLTLSGSLCCRRISEPRHAPGCGQEVSDGHRDVDARGGRGPDSMRILVNSETLSPNTGISVQTLQVARELAERGHRLDLVYIHDGPYRDEYRSFCDTMQQVPALDLEVHGALRQAPRLVPAVRAAARTRPDVIYLNRFKPLPWALASSLLTRAPVVCHLHGVVGIGTPVVNRTLSRRTQRFICVSHFIRDRFVAAGGDPARTDVIHNGIDQQDYPVGGLPERTAARMQLGLPEQATIVMFYGRVAPEKGVNVLVDAVAGLSRDSLRWSCSSWVRTSRRPTGTRCSPRPAVFPSVTCRWRPTW